MPRLEGRWAGVIAIAIAVNVAYGTMYYAYSVLIADGAAGESFSATTLSVAIAGSALVEGLTGLVVGAICDMRGVREVTFFGALLGGLGLLAFARAQEAWQVIAVWTVVLGPAGAMTFYGPAYVAVERWFGHQRGRALGVLTVGAGTSSTIFIPLTQILVDEVGWRDATAILAVILAALGASLALILPNSRPAQPVTRFGIFRSLGEATACVDRRFVLVTVAFLLGALSMQGLVLHQVAYLEDLGFSASSVAYALGLIGIISLPGRFVLPFLTERVDPARVSGAVFLGLALAALSLYQATEWWRVAVYIALFGAVFGALMPMRAAVMGSLYSGPMYGRLMGLQGLVVAVAGAAGPALIGGLRSATGDYRAGVVTATALLVLAVPAILAIRRPASARREVPTAAPQS